MDRVIEKKTWTTKRLLTIGGIVAIVALDCGQLFILPRANQN